MRARFLCAAVVAAALPSCLPAQTVGQMLENDIRGYGKDVLAVWLSPLHATPQGWLSTGLMLGAAAAVSPLDDNVDRWMVRNQGNVAWSAIKELREGGAAFSGKYVTPVAGVALIYGLATKNTRLQDGLFGCLASYTAGSVVRNYVVYYLVGRERPDSSHESAYESPPAEAGDQYNFTFPGKSQWGMHSLPAGHAANIMACAAFLNNRFDMGYAGPALYLLTAGIGAGRLVDRRHWTSDTVIGLVFGYAVGREVAKSSAKRAHEGRAAGAAASVLGGSYLAPGRGGITFGWKTTF
jgi:membrane-associated phospholipid phosphatase